MLILQCPTWMYNFVPTISTDPLSLLCGNVLVPTLFQKRHQVVQISISLTLSLPSLHHHPWLRQMGIRLEFGCSQGLGELVYVYETRGVTCICSTNVPGHARKAASKNSATSRPNQNTCGVQERMGQPNRGTTRAPRTTGPAIRKKKLRKKQRRFSKS